MTWRASLQEYMSQFGLPAYLEGSVPEDVVFPWMTYSFSKSGFSEESSSVVHLHYHTDSEAIPNRKADEICKAIEEDGYIFCDEGKIALSVGSPNWYPTNDEGDRTHKHRIINVTMLWLLSR